MQVRSLNNANLILPPGDVQLGLLDYNICTNSQLRGVIGMTVSDSILPWNSRAICGRTA